MDEIFYSRNVMRLLQLCIGSSSSPVYEIERNCHPPESTLLVLSPSKGEFIIY